MTTIKNIDLIGIVNAAGIWYTKMNSMFGTFKKEMELTNKLYNELFEAKNNPNDELMIEKLPF